MKKAPLSIALASILGIHAGAHAKPTLEIGGLVEVEAFSGKDAAGESTSDITVATVEVGLAARINDEVAAEVVLLHEEDETDFSVDTATVSLAFTDHLGLTAGQTTIPFGVFGSYMISDPLTLELAETRASMIQADIRTGPLTTSLYTFNGANTEEKVDNWGVNLAFTSEHLLFTAGYLANIGDTDSIAAETIDSRIPGISFSAGVNLGRLSLIGEFITATERFQPINGAFTASAQPNAANIELAFAMGATVLAVGMQQTNETEELGLPKQRTLACISHRLLSSATIALQWATDKDHAGERGDSVITQLAVAF